MSEGARTERKRRPGARKTSSAGTTPLHSHIRELAPRGRADVDSESTTEDPKTPMRSGFFAHAAKINMGNAFPALRTVARFLNLESYRSLPKHDKLPDLDEVVEAELDDLLEPELPSRETHPELLDWDEMAVEDLRPNPYQLYLFDLRIEEYLRQTKAQLANQLMRD